MRGYRRGMSGRTRKLVIGLAAVTLAGGAFAISTGIGNAGENCTGLDQALQNNLTFIAGQRANPDALSEARIANRQAVVDLINQRRAAAGCTAAVTASPTKAAAQTTPPKTTPPTTSPAKTSPAKTSPAKTSPAKTSPTTAAPAAKGVVCKGSTVTLSGEAGAPAASSGTFPIGTTLKVTNLDNNQSITVKVTAPSGSCVLLNDAAFALVHEPGKNLIRRALIEKVG
jgi:putative intracellular protease/amidase